MAKETKKNKMHKPIEPAFRRLFDAQTQWHSAIKSYFEPNNFRISINACIQELRNVTFVLQNNKRDIENFDEWYNPWQEKMRKNQSLKWLVSARNHIVKQGDLELKSIFRVSIIGSYLASETPVVDDCIKPSSSNDDVLEAIKKLQIPDELIENCYLRFQRRWVDSNYPDFEMLELLSNCWVALLELLKDAPVPTIEDNKNEGDLVSLPPCMYQGSETLSLWLKLKSGKIIPTTLQQKTVKIENHKEVKERYKDSPLINRSKRNENFKSTCELLFEQARFVIKKDGYHVQLAMLLKDLNPVKIFELINEDQADKYRTMRMIASEVEQIGIDSVVIIGEVWTAQINFGKPIVHASESPDRKEGLSLIGIAKSGEGYSFFSSFDRIGNKIKLGETINRGIEGYNMIQPILEVWKKSAKKHN